MKTRSILLAIGIAVTIFRIGDRVGGRSDAPVSRASEAVSSVIPAGGAAALTKVGLAGIVREVTAYNVGVPAQTSENPCIGASGKDLCRLIDEGRNVCAANFVALGTVLHIEKYGECVVLDRMHRRFAHRVDIAMKEDAIEQARDFGLQRRVVGAKY